MKQNNRARKKPIHRVVSIATAAIMVASLMPLNEMWEGARYISSQIIAFADGEEYVGVTITIGTAKEFVEYSNIWNTDNEEYQTNGEFDATKYNAAVSAHANDVIELAFSTGSTQGEFTNEENGTFCSIGSEAYPFTGIILINTDATGTLNLEKPLFNYLGDSAKILRKNGDGDFLPSTLAPYEISISRTEDNTGLPILANYVLPTLASNETAKEWKVKIADFSGNNYSYGGIIGTVKADSSPCVSVNYEAGSSKAWKGSGNIGRIVCDMEATSTLTVMSLTGNAGIEVTTGGGHAGGIVGAMESGSRIIMADSHSNAASLITAGGSGSYAGGVAGYCNGGTVEINATVASYTISHTLTGTAGAGGMFGYYQTAGGELDLSKYRVNCTLNSGGNVGAIFGELHNSAAAGATDAVTFTLKGSDNASSQNLLQSSHTETKAVNFGGLIGMYEAGKLSDALVINNLATSPANSGESDYYGGAIGKISGVAYTEIKDFWAVNCVNSNAASFGGAVGCADEAFVKVEDIAVSTSSPATYTGGGVVGHMEKGVLQLMGITDLSGTTASAGNTNGQILGYRDSALVFSSLDDEGNTWELIRGAAVPVDDIGTWGEVVRFSSTFSQDDVLTIADHNVTLANATGSITASGSVSAEEAFARFALNNQIRTSSGVLTVGSGAASLYQTDITMGTVDLTDTGLIGLTRDGSDKYLDYQGNISGGSVTLAIGQAYGKRMDGNSKADASTSEEGSGQIYRHCYLGLVGKTTGATTLSGTALQGSINADTKIDGSYYIGMAIGKAESDVTVDGVTISSATINVVGNSKSSVGGLIGQFDGAKAAPRKLYIGQTTACTFGASLSGGAAATGGVIGKIANSYYKETVDGEEKSVESEGQFEVNIGQTTVTGSVTGSGKVGGLIATILKSTQKQNRDLTLTNVSTGLLMVENGALLGDTWYDTEVQLGTSNSHGVTIGSSSNASTVKGSGAMAGLVYHATGQWIVNDINITNLYVDSTSVDSFGVLVNKGYKTTDTNSALFMWLKNGYDYSISSITGSGTVLDNASVFDEIVAYSADGDVTANGQGIVSIATTNGVVNMTKNSSDNNSYVGQTNWGKVPNFNTRYYYNLDDLLRSSYGVIDDGSALSSPKKLLVWSIQQYADSSLSGYFKAPYANGTVGTTADVFDMTGLSYYPVNIDAGKTVTLNGTVTLYNEEVEKTVTVSSPENKSRSTLNETQHFLMQNSIFNNVAGNLKIGTITLKGNVGHLETGGTGSGVLVCGELKGSGPSATAKLNKDVTTSTIYLAGIEIWNKDENSPLLINTIPRYADVTVIGVKTIQVDGNDAYANGKQVASSLIGDVGSTDATDISIVFKDIVLDARLENSKLKSATAATALADATAPDEEASDEAKAAYQKLVNENAAATLFDNVYHTKNTIFTKASFLKSLSYNPDYKSSITAEYNYAFAKDWAETSANSGVYNHIAQVTYGAEISLGASSQYNGLEYEYSDENYNSPLEAKPDSQYEEFDDVFIRYVFTPYSVTDNTYQLKINHHNTDFSGCGTYNDPYLISSGTQFNTITGILSGTNPTDIYIGIPSDGVNSSWCTATKNEAEPEHTPHVWYKYGTSSYEGYTWNATTNEYVRDTSKTLTEYQMRNYLAKAYYKLDSAITLGDSFEGIGEYQYESGKYAVFHGVIDGDGAHITMNTDKPFITASSGCVVKDVTFDVAHDITLNQGSVTPFTLQATTSCKNYGAVIGKVMGGDNILDNVHVSFADDKVIKIDGYKSQLVPVGAYIGVVVDGGVYFRNMDRIDGNGKAISYGLTNANVKGYTANSNNSTKWETDLINASTTKWLYVNPIIGRVINGFAVTESDAYRPFENGSRSRIYVGDASSMTETQKANYSAIVQNSDHIKYDETVTMQNGTKNWSIADIYSGVSSAEKLSIASETVNGVSTDWSITVPNAQSFFLMSLMVNSGMCQWDANDGYYTANMMSRGLASYESIGINETDSTKCTDYNNNAQYDIAGQNKPGYLIQKYTADGDKAKKMASTTANAIKLVKQDYILPDGYKGIGSFYKSSNYYRMRLTYFDGNGASISQNTSYNYYHREKGIAYNTNNVYAVGTDGTNGLGLFNYQNTSGTYKDFFLSGSVTAQIINSSNGSVYPYNIDSYGKMDGFKWILAVGMLMGCAENSMTINSVALEDVSVLGSKYAGGLIGNIPASNTFIKNDSSYDSDNITVKAGIIAGGMIGRDQQGSIDIDYNNCIFNITNVSSLKEATGGDGNYYNYGTGGLVGVCRARSASIPTGSVNVRNIVVGDEAKTATISCENSDVYAGGLFGIINRGYLSLNNCKVYNLSVVSQFSAGGIVGQWATSGGGSDWTLKQAQDNHAQSYIENTTLYSTLKGSKQAEIQSTGSTAYSVAGGFIGAGKEDMFDVIINNSSVQDYKISGTKYAGGCVGAWGDSSSTGGSKITTHTLEVNNVLVSGCNISAGTADGSSGGILGNLNAGHSGGDKYLFYGYNIMAENLSFSGKNQGYICGSNNKVTKNDIKIVGFSRQDNQTTSTMISPLIGTDDTSTGDFDSYGTNGYVVFADYNGTSLKPTNNTKSSYTKTTVTYDENDVATSTDATTNILYNTFTEDFMYSTTTDGNTTKSANVSNVETVTYRIPKINATTGKVERNNKGEIIYEVKTYSYGDNWPNVTSSPSYYLNGSYQKLHDAVAATADNPAIPQIDAQNFLTGDGVSSLRYAASTLNNIPDSVAKSIIDDINSGAAKAYLNTGLIRSENEEIIDELTPLKNTLSTDQKYSTFKKEMGTAANGIPRDFPVLVVDDINSTNTTTFIANYLKLLTNSDLDYSTDKTDVFTIRTAKCTYNSGSRTFKPDYSTCNLKYESGKGFSISQSYDNEEKDGNGNKLLVFSLIDVEFYDPSSTTGEIAYHLYVPVMVKKLLQFNFEATTLSGSSYQIAPEYTGNRRNTLLENFGNPVTLEFRYTYQRKLSDWRDAILSGENVLFSLSKDILIVSATEDPLTQKKDTPGPMKMVLVDPNKYSDDTRQNRSFYADNTVTGQTCIVTNGSNYQLKLTGFSSESGAAFSPKLVNDFLTVTATRVSGTGNFTIATGPSIGSTGIPEDATVRAVYLDESNEEKTVFLKHSEDNTGNYQISSTAEDHGVVYADGRNKDTDLLYEDYYVTLLTERPDPKKETYTAVAAAGGDYVASSEGTTGAIKARYGDGVIWLTEKGEGETGTYNIEKLYHYSFESMRQLTPATPNGGSKSYPTQSVQAKESHLYIGDLYNNTLTISTYHVDEEHPNVSDEITMASPELGVHLTAYASLTSTAKAALGNTVQTNNAISVYQSLLYTYNWNKTDEASQLGILAANDLEMVSYIVSGNQISNGDVTDKYSKGNADVRAEYLDETNKNYVELKNKVNIAKGLSSGVTIDAQFKLKYSEKSALTTQFAERTDDPNDTSGTYVIGYSNISSSKNDTANSAMSISKDGTARYYSTEDNMASLQYDAVGKYDDDFGELGINANDLSEAEQSDGKTKIETVAYYSLDNWSSIRTPQKIRLEFELYDKYGKIVNGTRTPYSNSLTISDYLTDFKVYTSKDVDLDGTEGACTVTQSEKIYTYTIDLNEAGYQLLDYNEGLDSYTFYVDYSVKTGKKAGTQTWFENTKMYQNYMVKLTVSLLVVDENGDDIVLPGSNPNNHIIYTNARINPDIIDTATP